MTPTLPRSGVSGHSGAVHDDIEIETMTSSLRTDIGCRFAISVSSRGPLTCDDASRLTRCHRALVSNSCHFFRTPQPVRGRHTQSLRDTDKPVQNVPSRHGYP